MYWLGRFAYSIVTTLYPLVAQLLGSLGNKKAKAWADGRKYLIQTIRNDMAATHRPRIWIHCASLGEFEQGRPVLEALKHTYPTTNIVLTFFSPSGYEVQKHYKGADYIYYLPADSKLNAQAFMNAVQPQLVLFVKYEFWWHYLQLCKQRQIPLFLVSGIFRANQPFFQWYGDFHRKMLDCFSYFFVQEPASAQLLHQIGIQHVAVTGDTRFDRVLRIANTIDIHALRQIQNFIGNRLTLVAGSTWTEDDEEIDHFVNTHPAYACIVAPHDVSEERINECMRLYQNAIRYSAWIQHELHLPQGVPTYQTLIIDNVGMLSKLYYLAHVAFIGGGFNAGGIHNVLEAAVYGKPVVHGPVYEKYQEAVGLLNAGGSFVADNALVLEDYLTELFSNSTFYEKAAKAAAAYVQSQAGATDLIMEYLKKQIGALPMHQTV
ncbi:MAG: 3-deoxy-D-manno-octulosonic acid transferase [Chitinophagaceae bacterium]